MLIGDWHLELLRNDTGDVTERMELVRGGGLVWRLEVQLPVAGPPGLPVSLRVLVGVDVSLGTSAGVDSFGVCWIRTSVSLIS